MVPHIQRIKKKLKTVSYRFSSIKTKISSFKTDWLRRADEWAKKKRALIENENNRNKAFIPSAMVQDLSLGSAAGSGSVAESVLHARMTEEAQSGPVTIETLAGYVAHAKMEARRTRRKLMLLKTGIPTWLQGLDPTRIQQWTQGEMIKLTEEEAAARSVFQKPKKSYVRKAKRTYRKKTYRRAAPRRAAPARGYPRSYKKTYSRYYKK